MAGRRPPVVTPPPTPARRLCIGVTGHRALHPAVAGNAQLISAVFDAAFAAIASEVAAASSPASGLAPAFVRLHCLLADGTDQNAAQAALDRGWELVCPLPFGRRVNTAINAAPATPADVRALLAGQPAADAATADRAAALEAFYAKGRLFELAECDERIAALYLASCDAPPSAEVARLYDAEISRRVALAGTVMLEQSDVLIALWDGKTTAHVGGTGHTVAGALAFGTPVLWIDPAAPEHWRLLETPEALAVLTRDPGGSGGESGLRAIVRRVLDPDAGPGRRRTAKPFGPAALTRERWHPRSTRFGHGYRRIEAMFGGGRMFRSIVQRYEQPDAIGGGSGAALLATIGALPGSDPALPAAIERDVLRRFAWSDGISARLSDAYRGGMMVSFVLSSLAVVGGISYLPFIGAEGKWPFSVFELAVIGAILMITFVGTRRRWHSRWFEIRRVAEYLRYSPLLILLGVARPPWLWPVGTTGSWPEWYARQAIREVGLPRIAVTAAYLRAALDGPLAHHATTQRDYHAAKAHRLKRVHLRLDFLSSTLFQLAVVAVAVYLSLKLAVALGGLDGEQLTHMSKFFTLLGVVLPSFASAISGIRFFGDFERFAAISEVAAEKLDGVLGRVRLLQAAPDGALDYARVAELAHGTDAVVVDEIESWQSVFGGKQISIPA